MREWGVCVDHDAVLRDVLFGGMQARYEFAFGSVVAPFALGPRCETLVQGFGIDVGDGDFVEEVNEVREVSRPAAEEGYRMGVVGDERLDLVDIPDVIFVASGCERLAGFWIALIGEFPVAVDCLVAAPLQLVTDGGLAGAGNAFDQIVSDAHFVLAPLLRSEFMLFVSKSAIQAGAWCAI